MEFRQAFLNIIFETRRYYRTLFGIHTLGMIELNAYKSRNSSLRLWTNGADRIYLRLSRKAQLEPSIRSGVHYLHGLTHEVAHIVLYRSIINLSQLAEGWGEGWAIYLASFWGVPHLYEVLGEKAWPYPHNYILTDGPSRHLRAFANSTWSSRTPTQSVVYDLYRWERQVGRKRFISYFRRLFQSPVRADVFNARVMGELRKLRLRAS